MPTSFWQEAEFIVLKEQKSLHLKLDAEVFLWFEALGKGHLTHKWKVLKAYADAQRKQKAK